MKIGRPAIGGSLDNQTRFLITMDNDLVQAVDDAAARGDVPPAYQVGSRAALIRRMVGACIAQYRSVVLGMPKQDLRRMPCPCCLGYVDGPHADACGYFGDRSDERASSNLKTRLSVLAARFDQHPIQPALEVAAALQWLDEEPRSAAARDALSEAFKRLRRHVKQQG
jgi:hypothetical protein